jgi:DNA-directed RNA polymerase specialized sigma24 family protein
MSEKLNKKQKQMVEELVSENYELFVNVSKKIVKNRDDAEEVVHKTLVYIMGKVIDGSPIRNLVGYTITGIRHRSLNYLRDKKKHIYLPNHEIEVLETLGKIKEKF